MFNGRRQPSCGGTSRMMREYQVRICERLGVKFPGPTRPLAAHSRAKSSACPASRAAHDSLCPLNAHEKGDRSADAISTLRGKPRSSMKRQITPWNNFLIGSFPNTKKKWNRIYSILCIEVQKEIRGSLIGLTGVSAVGLKCHECTSHT